MKPTFLAIAAAGVLTLAASACSESRHPSAVSTVPQQPATAAASNSAAPAASGAAAAATSGSAATSASAANVSKAAPASTTLTTASKTLAANDTVSVVNAVRPSVVRVHSSQSQIGAFGGVQNATGVGTGIIYDTQGHILTNNHVVTLGGNQAVSNLSVDLADGRQNVPAKLVGREPTADLAVLQISADNLTPAKFADPKSIEVGQDVVAIGYALDLGSTPSVTKGVVSALDREIDETVQGGNSQFGAGTPNIVGGAIQTDTAINEGNSGGPLVNMSGEVIGINTAGIFSQNGTPVQGINFAVSVETVQPVAKALIDKGQVDRGFMGVNLQPITSAEASAQHLAVQDGVGVAQVVPGGPADKAGLKAGDIITKLGDRDIHTYGDLQQSLILNGPGTKLHVEFYRGSNKQSTDITLAARPQGT